MALGFEDRIGRFEDRIGQDVQGSPEINQESLDAVNQMLQQSVGTDLEGGLQILGYLNLGINILYLMMFLATAVGLYKLSKKLGDDHSWLAFVPLIQIYTLIKTSGYGFIKGFLLLILFFVIGIFLSGITMMGMSPFIASMFLSGSIAVMVVGSLLATVIMNLVIVVTGTFFLHAGMARRAGQSSSMAILMTLFPWCMLWIVSNRIGDAHISAPQEKLIIEEI